MKPHARNVCSLVLHLCIAQPTFGFPNLEFEIGAGLASGDAQVPALNARVGVNPWESVTLSLRGLAVIGEQETYIPGGITVATAAIRGMPFSASFGITPGYIGEWLDLSSLLGWVSVSSSARTAIAKSSTQSEDVYRTTNS